MFKRNKKEIICVLDIGSFKISAMIANVLPTGEIKLLKQETVQSMGIKSGSISDINKAAYCIEEVVRKIEKQKAGVFQNVYVSVSGANLKSYHVQAMKHLNLEKPISNADIQNLIDLKINEVVETEEEVLHVFPLSYQIDGEESEEPVGQFGKVLELKLHIVAMPKGKAKNLLSVLDRAKVKVAEKVAAPYAEALAVLSHEEMRLGATMIDFGGETTSFAMMQDGCLFKLGVVPLGMMQITQNIAGCLSCSLEQAEKIKVIDGSALESPEDSCHFVNFISANNTEKTIPKKSLVSVIVQGLDVILKELILKLVDQEKISPSFRIFVLTGGGAHLNALKAKIESSFHVVRLSKMPQMVGDLKKMDVFSLSTCIGLVKYAIMEKKRTATKNKKNKKMAERIIQWFLKNF